jgi:diguanylate cyclase (GGDEF)-like protein
MISSAPARRREDAAAGSGSRRPPRRSRAPRNRLTISDRQLKIAIGGGLWFVATGLVVIASFVPQVAPEDAAFFRIVLGGASFAFAAGIFLIGPRIPDRYFQLAVELMMIPSLGMNLIMLQISPATEVILFNMIITMIYAGYFLRLPALLVTLGGAIAIALSTLATSPANDTPHLGSFLVIYVAVVTMTALLLHLQNSETLSAVEHSRRQGRTDPLTGLGNLRALERRAEQMLDAQPSKEGDAVQGLLLIDLDHFKEANAIYGHLGGDHALRAIAEQLQRVAPSDALVTRIGGDEFAVLLAADTPARIAEIGETLRGAVRGASALVELPGVSIDATVGVAVHPVDGDDLAALLDSADRAMYAVKGEKRHTMPDLERSGVRSHEPPPWLDETPDRTKARPTGPRLTLDLVTGGGIPWLASRTLYARTSTIAWSIGSIVLGLSLLVPDAYPDPTLPWWGAIFGGLAMAPAVLLANRDPQTPMHVFFDGWALVMLAAVIATTGGIESTAAPLLVMLAVSQAWFWEARAVAFRLIGPVLVALSPLFYTEITGSDRDQLALITICGLASLLVTLVVAMYVDRVFLTRLRRYSEHLAATDPLTEIANRRSFETYVQGLIDEPGDEPFAVVMLDLDNFKAVNTERGHSAGDRVLKAIAAALEQVAREDDCIARVGGDEFAAALPGVGIDQARALAERFVEAVAAVPEAAEYDVSASAGFAMRPQHGETLDELMFTADSALMAVKASGKGGTRVAQIVSAVR